ncbi:MAG: RecX family transcriptional regulator [Actinomycetota bacterium]|nr:RecX family transcriptional regulator [Actinomycetota bacterium]
MPAPDGERLATVTYLPGVFPASDLTDRSPSEQPAPEADAAQRRLPTFEHADRRAAGSKREFDRISNVSMHALARRGMSSLEMHDHLIGREFELEAVAAEIDRLERVGLLDDVALGETLVRTLRERKGLGRSALTAELRRRKLDPDAIGAALETLEDDELDRALALAVKRAPQLRVHDRDTAKRRLVAFLMRKGYSGSTSASAADRVLSGGYGAGEEARTGPVFR